MGPYLRMGMAFCVLRPRNGSDLASLNTSDHCAINSRMRAFSLAISAAKLRARIIDLSAMAVLPVVQAGAPSVFQPPTPTGRASAGDAYNLAQVALWFKVNLSHKPRIWELAKRHCVAGHPRLTNRSWTPQQIETLRTMRAKGASDSRAAVALKRPKHSVQTKAAELGVTFPTINELRKKRQQQEAQARAAIGLPPSTGA